MSSKNSGHAAGRWSLGTSISQYGSGSSASGVEDGEFVDSAGVDDFVSAIYCRTSVSMTR